MSQFKSAFEAIPGKDALLEYELRSYPEKTYVERNGLIYKSLTATSTTFLLSQWELVGDLREVRVLNIKDRNSLTGNTPTSGTTGINIPILDNTNVLVLNAAGDPQVGSPQFARYNYNQGTASWLLLQVGTGSTSAQTSIEYSNVLNKPFVLSGVTINAGAGLSGGGSAFGSIPAAGGSISIAHLDTSTQVSLLPTGRTYVQQLRFDTFGHVTGATTSLWTHPDTSSQANILNTGRTYIQSISLDGSGHVVSMSSSSWTHPDTSSQASSVNGGSTFIQSIQLDGDGHVIGLSTGVAAGGGGGGGSFALNVNGNSGGAIAINSGATLTISGGTNISTIRTGDATNPGIRINVNPAGSTNQVQLNNGVGALGASPNLTYNTSTNILSTANLTIATAPVSANTSNDFLTRSTATGAVQRITFSSLRNALVGAPANSIQYNNGNGFGGDAQWTYDPVLDAVTLGTRGVGGSQRGLAVGTTNNVLNTASVAIGGSNTIGAINSLVVGSGNVVSGLTSGSGQYLVFGSGNQVDGTNGISNSASFVVGTNNIHDTFNGYTIGVNNFHNGANGFIIGNTAKTNGGIILGKGTNNGSTIYYLTASASTINASHNTTSQVIGHGTHATHSAIFGGVNGNIPLGNDRAVIVGGNAIKITGTSYSDFVVVPNLAIWTAPNLGITTDHVLTYNATNKKVSMVTQASLKESPAGNNGSIQFRNNQGNFAFSSSLFFATGTSRLTTSNLSLGSVPVTGSATQILTRNVTTGAIERIGSDAIAALPVNAIQYRTLFGFGGSGNLTYDPSSNAFTHGTRLVGSTNGNTISFAFGSNAVASGNTSIAMGSGVRAGGFWSVAMGNNSIATGQAAMAVNASNFARGINSFAAGNNSNAAGPTSFAIGNQGFANGSYSFAGGYGFTQPILANTTGTFNFSTNLPMGAINQTAGHGANAQYSAILGGGNHNIEAGNDRAVIIGGNGVKVTGTSYVDYAVVQNLAIFNQPFAGNTLSDRILGWNPTNKKTTQFNISSLISIHQNIAYVSKNGNDSTGLINRATQPFLTIAAASAALVAGSAPSATNRCVVHVFPGQYTTSWGTLPAFVDYFLEGADIRTSLNVTTDTQFNIGGSGIVTDVIVASASKVTIECQKVVGFSTNALYVNHNGGVLSVKTNLVEGEVRWAMGQLVLNANIIRGSILQNGNIAAVEATAQIDCNILSGGTGPLVYLGASSTGNGRLFLKANRIINTNTVGVQQSQGSAIYLSDLWTGRATLDVQEIVNLHPTLATIGVQSQLLGQFNLKASKVVNRSAGNVPAINIQFVGATGKFFIEGGTRLIGSGTGLSIVGTGNVIALGDIYGKNANAGTVTIQLGTFTANNTFIVD
jgi:hypothetical protein